MNTRVQKEIAFNLYCREMAKDNVLLACNYMKSTLTGILAYPNPISKTTESVSLKDRCINLIKAPLLLLRTPLLYLPLINRVTQLALRFLSPQQAADFVKTSSCFSKEELRIRYNHNTLVKVLEDSFKKRITKKEKITKLDLDLSNDERTIFINKLKFTFPECNDIFLKVLTQFPENKCSINLKKEVNKYKKLFLN